MIFETDRLVVRPLHENDKDIYFRLYGDEQVMRYIRGIKSREDCEELLLSHIEINKNLHPMGRWLVDEKTTGKTVGSFVVIPIDKTDLFQLGYSLTPDHWGKGFATELVYGGLKYIFTQTPLDVIYAIAEDANAASQRSLVKAGFIAELILNENEKILTRFIYSKQHWKEG